MYQVSSQSHWISESQTGRLVKLSIRTRKASQKRQLAVDQVLGYDTLLEFLPIRETVFLRT
jgi:hypothetical protein